MDRAHRFRSLAWFIIAIAYYIAARSIAATAANGLSFGDWFDLVDRSILLFLLILGFAAMGYVGQRQRQPVKEMGLDRRPGWRNEFAMGSAIGWAGITICALLTAIFGGLIVVFYTGWRQFALVPLDLIILLIASLGEEIAFRGYAFQRLIEATNPASATLLLSLLFAVAHANNPQASIDSTLVTFLAGCLFSIAYLRTRALWVSWGLHFAWNASMTMLFGLPLSGLTQFSPVISSTAVGPTWLTGFDYGPEGSAVAIVVLLALMIATVKATRDLKHKYAQPVVIAAGIPVDIDAISRRQHEAAMGLSQPSAPQIVQIDGVQPPITRGEPEQATDTAADGEVAEPPQES